MMIDSITSETANWQYIHWRWIVECVREQRVVAITNYLIGLRGIRALIGDSRGDRRSEAVPRRPAHSCLPVAIEPAIDENFNTVQNGARLADRSAGIFYAYTVGTCVQLGVKSEHVH